MRSARKNHICLSFRCTGATSRALWRGRSPPDTDPLILYGQTCVQQTQLGAAACEGMTVLMEKLDDLVSKHLEKRLINPARLEEVLSTVPDRRQERFK
jgi:hypothetical protein